MRRARAKTKQACGATAGGVAFVAGVLASNGVLADASIAEPSTSGGRAGSQALGSDEKDAAAADDADAGGMFERLFLGLWRNAAGEAAREPALIVAKVRYVKQLMPANFYQIYLDNGQTWRENGIQPETSYRAGDSVVIYKLPAPREHLYDLENQRTGQVVRVNRVR